ncbi:MAG: hypothetical protein L6R48_13935 [Planctomycetes bacterium]|nr:hypothetical protein [Planctomycetota bacterium]
MQPAASPLAPNPAPAAAPAPIADRDAALRRLLDKYRIAGEGRIVADGDGWALATPAGHRALLPWRCERRFVELRRLVESRTLEDVSTLRFAALDHAGLRSLRAQMLRELDLCAFVAGAEVASVFAVCDRDRAANVVAALANGVRASVECSVLLPAGNRPVDRHEIIARRGVGSDRVVDTQVPQASIYAFGAGGERRFTDTDAELYGLGEDDVALVRAAMAVLQGAPVAAGWDERRRRLDAQVSAVFASDQTRSRVQV